MTPDSSANTPTWNVATAIHKHIVKQNIHVNLHSIEKLVVDDYSKAFY